MISFALNADMVIAGTVLALFMLTALYVIKTALS